MADIRGLDYSTTPNTQRPVAVNSDGTLKTVKPFDISLKLTRPSNTNTYTIGDLINSGPVIACATTDESVTVTPSNMRGIYAGMAVTGIGIAASTKVANVGTTTVVLDKAATATNAASAITFTAVGLLPIDFSTVGATASQYIQISSVALYTSYEAAAVKMQANLWLYRGSALQASCADEAAFAPTFANHELYRGVLIEDIAASYVQAGGTTVGEVIKSEIQRIVQLDSACKLYPALVAANAYVGASAETITLNLKGYLL